MVWLLSCDFDSATLPLHARPHEHVCLITISLAILSRGPSRPCRVSLPDFAALDCHLLRQASPSELARYRSDFYFIHSISPSGSSDTLLSCCGRSTCYRTDVSDNFEVTILTTALALSASIHHPALSSPSRTSSKISKKLIITYIDLGAR